MSRSFLPFLPLPLDLPGFFVNAFPKAKSLSRDEDDELLNEKMLFRRFRGLAFCRFSEDEVKNDFTPDVDGGLCFEMSMYDDDDDAENGSLGSMVLVLFGEPRFLLRPATPETAVPTAAPRAMSRTAE